MKWSGIGKIGGIAAFFKNIFLYGNFIRKYKKDLDNGMTFVSWMKKETILFIWPQPFGRLLSMLCSRNNVQ